MFLITHLIQCWIASHPLNKQPVIVDSPAMIWWITPFNQRLQTHSPNPCLVVCSLDVLQQDILAGWQWFWWDFSILFAVDIVSQIINWYPQLQRIFLLVDVADKCFKDRHILFTNAPIRAKFCKGFDILTFLNHNFQWFDLATSGECADGIASSKAVETR